MTRCPLGCLLPARHEGRCRWPTTRDGQVPPLVLLPDAADEAAEPHHYKYIRDQSAAFHRAWLKLKRNAE